MVTNVILGPIVSVFIALQPVPVAAVSSATSLSPGEQLAAEVTERAAAGWRLGEIDVGYSSDSVRLSLLMVGPDHARWLNLIFDTEGAVPTAYSSLKASRPKQVRFYRGEADIVSAMAAGPAVAMYDECGMLHIDNGADGVTLDEYDYYTVAGRVDGDRAPAALAEALASALESGYELVSLTAGPGASNGVDIELDGDHRLVLAVGLDRSGHVVSVETQVSPSTHVWQTYGRGADLSAALRAAGSLERISTSPGMVSADEASLVLGQHGAYSIEIDDFDAADFECPC